MAKEEGDSSDAGTSELEVESDLEVEDGNQVKEFCPGQAAKLETYLTPGESTFPKVWKGL